MSLFERLRKGLDKTRQLFRRVLVAQDTTELEELLLSADVGVRATGVLVDKIRRSAGRREVLEAEISRLLSVPSPARQEVVPPQVVMLVGVNGSGKTTTVGKLCRYYAGQGRRVVVAAADTYRDAAAEQLRVWAARTGVDIVLSQQGQDAAAVAFDAIQRAAQRGADVVLVDTAGRLHTRKDLMDEVVKIRRVCGKVKPGAPDEVWLVLDATVGQNGIRQAQAFHQALGLTGLIVTKLDGTAKGGVLIPIAMELSVPIRFVGTGEDAEDLAEFEPGEFARSLLAD
ncbi:MAG: signal recognition particle-docking protein FtsY [candidate division WOR-3 bacterium]